jgi:hypothetical protein
MNHNYQVEVFLSFKTIMTKSSNIYSRFVWWRYNLY